MNMFGTALAGADIPRHGVASMQDVHAIKALHPDPTGSVNSTFDLLCKGSRKRSDAPAMNFFLRTEDYRRPFVWKHRERMAKITQAANMFRRLGGQRGDAVAFILPKTHWVISGGEAVGIVFAINPLLETGADGRTHERGNAWSPCGPPEPTSGTRQSKLHAKSSHCSAS